MMRVVGSVVNSTQRPLGVVIRSIWPIGSWRAIASVLPTRSTMARSLGAWPGSPWN
jgi:hypothetical protein